MSPKYDSNAVGSSQLIDGRLWTVVAVYPIKVTTVGAVTGQPK